MIDFSGMKKLTIGGVELKQLLINGTQVWKAGYKNWVPFAIDTDGSIYQNGKGYIDGYRLSSSGALSSQTNTVTTGFIPYKNGDLIRMTGVSWKPPKAENTGGTMYYCYLMFLDASFNVLGSVNCYANASSVSGYSSTVRGSVKFKNSTGTTSDIHPTENNGIYTFDQYTFSADADKVAYFRINGYGSGADMIVTINEETI